MTTIATPIRAVGLGNKLYEQTCGPDRRKTSEQLERAGIDPLVINAAVNIVLLNCGEERKAQLESFPGAAMMLGATLVATYIYKQEHLSD